MNVGDFVTWYDEPCARARVGWVDELVPTGAPVAAIVRGGGGLARIPVGELRLVSRGPRAVDGQTMLELAGKGL